MAGGQSRGTNTNAGCYFLPHRSSSRLRATFVLLGALRFLVARSRIFFVLEFSLDNSTYERCFCGASALFLWKFCVRFQIAAAFAVQPANAFTFRLECQLPGST